MKMHTISYNFSTKKDGDMRNDQNLIAFLNSKGLSYQAIIRPTQTHSDHVHIIHKIPDEHIHTIPDCDGIITTRPGLVLTIVTADCVPLIFIDTTHGVIGASHQGWKGTYARMAQKMVKHMQKAGAQKQSIEVIFGPSICGNCYTVSHERYDLFATEFSDSISMDHTLDLQNINYHQLIETGIKADHITVSSLCTKEHDDYYSFRGDTKETFGEIVTYTMLQYKE